MTPADADGSTAPDLAAEPSMIRSEEVLSVGTRTVVSGRVRMHKRVVTETVTQTVEIRREELVIEREPVETDARSESPATEAVFVDTDYEIVLHEERVVVTKQVVPIERVRLRTHVVTGQTEVSEDLQREQIELLEDPTR